MNMYKYATHPGYNMGTLLIHNNENNVVYFNCFNNKKGFYLQPIEMI